MESPIFDSTEYPLTVFVVGSKEGGRGDDQEYFTGDIAEVIIFDKALTSSEQEQVEDYLLEKYDL